MTRRISVMFIAAAAAFMLWNISEAQYPQDTTKTMRSDTTMRHMQTDTIRALYPRGSADTSTRGYRYNPDTARVRSWTPSSSQPDTSTGVH